MSIGQQSNPSLNSSGQETNEFSPYRARSYGFLGIWREREWSLKAYRIHHDAGRATRRVLDTNLVDAARRHVRGLLLDADREGHHHHNGFVIIHQGLLANWLLTHWWAHEDICCQILSRSDLDAPERFEVVTRPLMACVWELVVIDFERRTWVDAVLGRNGGRERYLEARLPDGLY